MAATKRQDAKAATVAKMRATAADLFRQRGYTHVTIRDVASAAGMSTGAVFATFNDKDDMFLKSVGRVAPNEKRITSFLEDVASVLEGNVLGYSARMLLKDLYGEQPK